MPFQKVEKISPVYRRSDGELLHRVTDTEGKNDPTSMRYDTGEFKVDGTTPIIAYFVPLNPAEREK